MGTGEKINRRLSVFSVMSVNSYFDPMGMDTQDYVVSHERFGKLEYMGRDKLWCREPENCLPFTDAKEAEKEAEKLRAENA